MFSEIEEKIAIQVLTWPPLHLLPPHVDTIENEDN